eukprot:128520_1
MSLKEQYFISWLNNLPMYSELQSLEQILKNSDALDFDTIYTEKIGKYLFDSFLITQQNDMNTMFNDIKIYKNLKNKNTKLSYANKILAKCCSIETNDVSLSITNENHFYDEEILTIKHKINNGYIDTMLFDSIYIKIKNYFKYFLFPIFLQSKYYKTYIRYKAIENNPISIDDFTAMNSPKIYTKLDEIYFIKKRNKNRCVTTTKKGKKTDYTHGMRTLKREIDLLRMMNSPFAISLRYLFTDRQSIYIATEAMLGGKLKKHLAKETHLPPKRLKYHIAEILLGLEYIHNKGVVFRGLRLGNILIDADGHCKISDFSFAKVINQSNHNIISFDSSKILIDGFVRCYYEYNIDYDTFEYQIPLYCDIMHIIYKMYSDKSGEFKLRGYTGFPGHTAPEVVLGMKYDHLCDYFSFGVVIYRCLSGTKPFVLKSTKSRALDRNVLEMEPKYLLNKFSPCSMSLIKGLLVKDVRIRLGRNGICDIKQHPWFDEIDFDLLANGCLKPPFKPVIDELKINKNKMENVECKVKESISDLEQKFKDLEYISKDALQNEIIGILERDEMNYLLLDKAMVIIGFARHCCDLISYVNIIALISEMYG